MRLSLEKTWTECIKMWTWIVKQHPCSGYEVSECKLVWLDKHYPRVYVEQGCFFCDYAYRNCTESDGYPCKHCPGRLVDGSFSCTADDYCYYELPAHFLDKLRELNRKRKAKQRRK